MADQSSNDERRTQRLQVIASMLVAAIIVILTVALVTARIGPGIETREKREELKELQDELKELQDEREELREGD
jgi:hypothetical protein